MRQKRRYDAKWRKLRARYLRAYPACIICGGEATEVDHIANAKENPHLMYEWTNLRSMCKRHHSMRTQRDEGSAKGMRTAIGPDGYPLPGEDHHWNPKTSKKLKS